MAEVEVLGITGGCVVLMLFFLSLLRQNDRLRRKQHSVRNALSSITFFLKQACERHPDDEGLQNIQESVRAMFPLVQADEGSLVYLANKQYKNPSLGMKVFVQKAAEDIRVPGQMSLLLSNLASNSAEAGAKNIWITATPDGLEIRDDGQGLQQIDGEGQGLSDIQKIAEECGFRLTFSTVPADEKGSGTIVRLERARLFGDTLFK